MLQDLKIDQGAYVLYKLFNSLFLGISVGSVFTIYTPLATLGIFNRRYCISNWDVDCSKAISQDS